MIPKTVKNKLKKLRTLYFFFFKHNSFRHDKYNSIIYGHNTLFEDCCVKFQGKNNKIVFGDNCSISGLRMLIIGENNLVTFGDDIIIGGSKYQPVVINAVGGKTISVGKGSLIANNTEIHTTDYHGIYDENGKRLNYDKDIVIGDNVWIGLGCKILKGASIPDGCIVGAGSLVSGKFEEKNAILAGNPSKVIKHNIRWDRARMDELQMEQLQKAMQ